MNLRTNWKKWGLSLMVCSAIIFVARVNNPPDRRSGAPGDGSCGDAGCHTGGTTMDGEIDILGLPDRIEEDSTYRLTVMLSNPNGNASRGGFQLTAIGSDQDSIGTFSNTDLSSVITQSLNRNYWEHQPAKFFDVNDEAVYEVDWTAPSEMEDSLVYFYTTGVIANGNGANSGDLVVSTADTLPLIAGIPEFEAEIIRADNVSCFGEQDGLLIARGIGGIPPYNYVWNNGDMDSVAEDLAAGTYRVTVSDSDGNSQSLQRTIRQPDSLLLSADVIDVQCSGDLTGSITVQVTGGAAPFQYDWLDGTSGQTRTNLPSGIYNVTVTDDNDCQASLEIFVTEPGFFIDEDEFIVQDEQCFGDRNGLIDLRPGIGGGSYSFIWTTGSQDTTIRNLLPGDYGVTITDFNNCTYEYDFTIDQPDELTISLQTNDVFPQGAMNGEIRATASGGTSPYSYSWSTSDNGPLIRNLGPGEYTVTVTDENGCTEEATAEITEPDCSIQILEDVFSTSCFMQCDGAICPRVVQGTPPYDFEWNNGAADSCITNLCPGTYRVTVTDQEGCVVVANFPMNQPEPISVNSTIINNDCFGESNGRIMYEIGGGTPPYSINPENLSGLSNGSVEVTITDANGCELVREETISSPNPITVFTDSSRVASSGESDGAYYVTVEGGTEPYTFLWLDGDGFSVSNSEDLEGFPADCYRLTVLDGNGCSERFDSLCIELETSLQEMLGATFKMYPNPADQVVYFELDVEVTIESIELYDITGKLLKISQQNFRNSGQRVSLEINEITNEGLHLVKIRTDRGTAFKKLMIH